MSTRICVKNLPKTFDSEDLRQFLFAQKLDLQITDCRLLKNGETSRRVAFVGLKTPQMAQLCVQKLNKAYCKTCRLSVELAKPPAVVQQQVKQVQEKSNEEPESSKAKKPKDDKVERRKKEFLAAMGVDVDQDKTSKFWANDDLPVNDNGDVKNAEDTVKRESTIQPPPDDSDSDDDDDNNSVDSESSEDSADPLANHVPKPSVQSDLDFLKSKQVETEDLDATEEKHDSNSDSDSDSDSTSDSEVPMKTDTTEKPQEDEASSSSSSSSEDDSDDNGDKEQPSTPTLPTHNDDEEETNIDKNRLFLRNLPFDTTEDELREHFASYGVIQECHLPSDDDRRSKGFAFIRFATPDQAALAKDNLDGIDFQGRIMHIHFAKRANGAGDDLSKLSYKDRTEKERQLQAEKQQGWSASFVRGDAVVDTLASRLGLTKGDVLGVKDGMSSGDAAVRLALGETAVIEENRKYLAENGYDMEALVSANSKDESIERSKTAILAKNLPNDASHDDLLKMFGSIGTAPSRVLLPPSKTIAVIEYAHTNDAKNAFRKLAYRRFKSLPLYLEYAPLKSKIDAEVEKSTEKPQLVEEEPEEVMEATSTGPVPTLYVKNLNFSTTEEGLKAFFAKECKVRSVRIPKKSAPVTKGSTKTKELSMGYGFVELTTDKDLERAMRLLNGKLLQGHALELKPSASGPNASLSIPLSQGKNPTKITVRNVPFEASRNEILQLFGSYGQLKKVRLPKKFNGTHRGFAFVEFISHKEAEAAMKALSRTHLYGRHLVLEWAVNEEESVDDLRAKAKRGLPGGLPKSLGKKTKFT